MGHSPVLVNSLTWQLASNRYSAQIAQKLFDPLRDQAAANQTDGQPHDWGNSWKGMIIAAYERTVSLPQDRFTECGGTRANFSCRVAFSVSLCFLLTISWAFYLLVLAFSIWEPRVSLLDSLQPFLCL